MEISEREPIIKTQRKVSVLIVDDIPTNVDVLTQVLEPMGFDISMAPSGEIALQIAPKLLPDIILLDVMMGGIDGFQTCKLLKENSITREIPVIFITARNDLQDLMNGFKIGAVDYICKPFNFEEVIARVGVHLQNQRLLKERIEMLEEYKRLMSEISRKGEEAIKAKDQAIKANDQLKNAQSHLVHSEKMAALGEMVSGIGHEINNPINFVLNNVVGLTKSLDGVKGILDKVLSVDESGERVKQVMNPYWDKSKENLDSIKEGVERIADIVKSLRNFSRHGEGDLKDVDINEIVRGTLRIMAHNMQEVHFETKFKPVSTIACSPSQISQVILNLVSNAVYAATMNKEGPAVTITIDEDPNYVLVKISDNGPGIPEKVKDKIFEPFFTTKPVGEGSGLGLSICYRIVQEHKGKLEFETGPLGTDFYIKLAKKPEGN